jgi:hypothetical protein
VINYEDEEEFQKELARRCHPEWSEEEVQAEADKEIRSHRNYEEELRCWLLRADDLKDDPTWFWCGMCECLTLKCEHCSNSSCNAGGCSKDSEHYEECHNRFMKAIALSWAGGGSLGDVSIPSWYVEKSKKLEFEQSATYCEECREQRLSFAKAMILDRSKAEKEKSTFTCGEHPQIFGGNLLVDKFLNQIESAEHQRSQNET